VTLLHPAPGSRRAADHRDWSPGDGSVGISAGPADLVSRQRYGFFKGFYDALRSTSAYRGEGRSQYRADQACARDGATTVDASWCGLRWRGASVAEGPDILAVIRDSAPPRCDRRHGRRQRAALQWNGRSENAEGSDGRVLMVRTDDEGGAGTCCAEGWGSHVVRETDLRSTGRPGR